MWNNPRQRRRAWRDVLLFGALSAPFALCVMTSMLISSNPVFAVLASAALIAALVAGLRELYLDTLRDVPRGVCAGCGYDLTGNESGVCPECGTSVSAADAANRDKFEPR